MLAYGFFNLSTVQFSVIIKPLFESFKGVVSTSSLDELHRTALSWLDEHCSLPILRPSKWGLHGGVSHGSGCRKPRLRRSWSARTWGRRVRPCRVRGCSASPRPSAVSVYPADDRIQLVSFEHLLFPWPCISLFSDTLSCSVLLIRIKAVYSGHRDKQEQLRVCSTLLQGGR